MAAKLGYLTPDQFEKLDAEGSCNTPQKIPELEYSVKIDWLTLLADIKSPSGLEEIKTDVEDIFSDQFVVEAGTTWRGRNWSGGLAKSEYGIELSWDSISEENNPKLRLSIPGRACSRADVYAIAMFINGLNQCKTLANISCTRLDVAFDDHTKSLFNYRDLYDAWEKNQVVRLHNSTHVAYVSGDPTGEHGMGWMHQWGSGRKTITFYNKAAESKGAIDSHRIEVRYKEKDANEAFKDLRQLPMDKFEEFCIAFLSGLIAGVVDFMDFPKGRNHGTRDGVRVRWWQSVLDVQEGNINRYSFKPPKPSLKRKLDWAKRQVMPSLAQISDVIGPERFQEWIDARIARAKETYSDIHKRFIHVSKLEFDRGIYTEGTT